jgi:hypothetical protein
MSEQPTLYRRSTAFPFDTKETLWYAFHTAAAVEWAKGRPPSAVAIANAMVKVLVPVEPVGFAFLQGGLSGALYRCEQEDADFMLIPVEGG